MSESIQQAITAARSLSPEVRAIVLAQDEWAVVGSTHEECIARCADSMAKGYGLNRAFWLDYFRARLVTDEKPAEALPEACWKQEPAPVVVPPAKNEQPTAPATGPRVTSRRTNGRVHVHPETRDAARTLEQLSALKAPDKMGRTTTLGKSRLAGLLTERGTKCSPSTLFNIGALEQAHFAVSVETAAEVGKALRALLAELTKQPDPTPPPAPKEGPEWVSNFEPLESTKPEREKVRDEVRALQALASGCMWPNVLAARFGWSEGYARQVVDRLLGQGRVKKDQPGKLYITHLGRKATLEVAA